MDSQGDDVASSWPFDALTSPPQSFLNLQFASPPSPLWVFEEGAAAAAAAAAAPGLDISTSDLEFTRLLTREFDFGNAIFTDKKSEGSTTPTKPTIPLPPPSLSPSPSMLESSQDSNFTDNSCLIKQKLTQALRYFKESTDQHILVQVWAPVKKGDRFVLTTSGQPFVLDPQSIGLLQYRTVSLTYVFSVDGDNNSDLGLPGRVYRQKVPEWTPNVQFYSLKEYPRLSHAVSYNVRGTVALPVFDPMSQTCVAVVELIMTSRKINYASEVDKVCKALEAVNLKSTEILDHPNVQIRNEGRQSAFVEILETLTTVCESHKLPLAQTWVPCHHRNVLSHGGGISKTCSSMDDTCSSSTEVCMSASDIAFVIIDPNTWGFRDACVEHHIKKGQGAAGKAFLHRKPCWVKNVSVFDKAEWPMVHYAIMFHLKGCFAICVRSEFTGEDEYVLEFFLPEKCDEEEQRRVLEGVIRVLRGGFKSLRLVDGFDLGVGNFEMVDFVEEFGGRSNNNNGEVEYVDNVELLGENNVNVNGGNGNCNGNVNGGGGNCNGNEKELVKVNGVNGKPVKKRGKAEKMISLEVLQQYFSGSLKSAAKSLGVCPTTMKRICRHHGITRWPSRKINKVNRSLSKLKQVIESVQNQAPDGTFTLPSISTPPFSVQHKPSKPALNPNPNPKLPSPSRSKSSSGEDSINSRTTGESSPVENPPVQLNGMLLEDSGSSKDLKTLLDVGNNLQTITIKASYKEDIIRFRFNVLAGVLLLKDEVASRLKLEIGMFEIKYLDDDNEWVKLACDSDLEECMEISRVSSKNGIVRLSVSDCGVCLGSSCESTGGLNG